MGGTGTGSCYFILAGDRIVWRNRLMRIFFVVASLCLIFSTSMGRVLADQGSNPSLASAGGQAEGRNSNPSSASTPSQAEGGVLDSSSDLIRGHGQGKLSLHDAIEIALKANPEIADAEDAVIMARSNLSLASRDSLFNPTVKIETNANAGWDRSMKRTYDAATLSLSVQDSLPTGRKLMGPPIQEALAELKVKGAERNLALVREKVIYKTTSAYFTVLKAQKSLELAQKSLEISQTLFRDAKLKLQLGIASTSDVLKSQQDMDEAKQNLSKAAAALELAYLEFNQVTGCPLGSGITALVDQQDYAPAEYDLQQLLDHALKHRVELYDARDKLTEANLELKKLIQAKGPIMTITGGYAERDWSFGLSAGDPEWNLSWQLTGQCGEEKAIKGSQVSVDANQRKPAGWYAGVNISWTPLDGGTGAEREKQARLTISQLERQVRVIESQIEVSVRQAFNELQAARHSISNAENSMRSAEENLRILKARLERGSATERDITQGEFALHKAKVDREFAIYDSILAEMRLHQAIGKQLSFR